MQKLYKERFKDADIWTAWQEPDQCTIGVRQWFVHHLTCVKVKSGRLEHN